MPDLLEELQILAFVFVANERTLPANKSPVVSSAHLPFLRSFLLLQTTDENKNAALTPALLVLFFGFFPGSFSYCRGHGSGPPLSSSSLSVFPIHGSAACQKEWGVQPSPRAPFSTIG